MTTIVCPIKTITRYYCNSLPTLAAKYTHWQNVLIVAKRVERSRSIVIIKHKYMLMCNHNIRINLMRCLRNSTTRREIGQCELILLVNYCKLNSLSDDIPFVYVNCIIVIGPEHPTICIIICKTTNCHIHIL